jgi:gamma-glutamylcyclotransferase (GGCT)/AIG2-like uncharacterized protein YtfP
MPNLFVYGSLMKGLRLHKYLENSKFLGEGWIYGNLYINPMLEFPAPIVILADFDNDRPNLVDGEFYEVSDETLNLLDLVEGCPHLYKRVSTNGVLAKNRTRHLKDTQVYVYPGDCIPSGSWREASL